MILFPQLWSWRNWGLRPCPRDLLQGLCYEVSQRNLHLKTLQEDAVMTTGKSIIVHHPTMTNKPHRHFQLGLVGGDTHQTDFFTAFVSY